MKHDVKWRYGTMLMVQYVPLLVGVLASTIINPSGPSSILQKNYAQLPIQGIGVAAAVALELGGTYIISRIVDATMGLRVTTSEKESGLDVA